MLHTWQTSIGLVKRPFAVLHARTFCHASEDLDKVMTALENTVGKSAIRISRTEGHHGNPISILETTVEDAEGIDTFFSKLDLEDVDEFLSSLSSRIDDSCNLFIRLDKQAAFKGETKLGRNDDVISVRVRVRSFPSKCEVAASAVREYLEGRSAGRGEP
jgi:RNA binding exosome subunit